MTVKLSPLFNNGQLDDDGTPLSGGKLYWYLAETSTLATIYTDNDGVTAHANPIILDSRGEPPNPIWLTTGITYKAVLKDAVDNQIRVIDNISGVNDTSIASFGEWIEYIGAVTYISGTSFSVAGDQTSIFTLNRRIKATVSGGICYASITSSAFSAGITTVVLQVDSISFDAGLSIVNYGLLNPAYPSITVPAAGKNIIHNGNFVINQRRITSPFTSTSANQYGFDRWFTVTSGQAISWATLNNGHQITVPAGGYAQIIEGINIKGGTYILSWSGTATATVNGAAVINGGNVTLPAATNATVSFFGGTVGEVQLERGASRTAFEFVDYQQQLALCQRYLPAINGESGSYIGCGQVFSTTQAFITVRFAVPARDAVTAIVASAASCISGLKADGTAVAFTAIGFQGGSKESCLIQIAGASGLVAGNASQIYFNTASSYILFTGAEL